MKSNSLYRNSLVVAVLSCVLFGIYEYFEDRQRPDAQKLGTGAVANIPAPREKAAAVHPQHAVLLKAVHDLISAKLASSVPISFLPREDIVGVGPDIWYVRGNVETIEDQDKRSRFEYSVAVRQKKDCPTPSSQECLQIIRKPQVRPLK